MKKFVLSLFLFSTVVVAKAQSNFTIGDDLTYAIIKDPDGFVNIHDAPSSTSKIIGKIYDNRIFSCEQNGTNWWKVLQVDEFDRSYFLEGYIYKDRVSFIPAWKEIKNSNPVASVGVFKAPALTVSLQKSTFSPKSHKLFFILNKELVKIDGKPFWGTDGKIPKEVISSIEITLKDEKIIIPMIAFRDLFEPNFKSISASFSGKNTVYIKMDNSDGDGAYSVIWIIKNDKYLGRYIDNSQD